MDSLFVLGSIIKSEMYCIQLENSISYCESKQNWNEILLKYV